MAQVTIRIGGYSYTVGCQDGQEEHLRAMAAKVDETVSILKAASGPGGEARLLMMAALFLADRVHDLETSGPPPAPPPPPAGLDPAVVDRLARAAEQAELIAGRLERA